MSSQPYSLLYDVEEVTLESSIEPKLALRVKKHYVPLVDKTLQFAIASQDVVELGGTITVSF